MQRKIRVMLVDDEYLAIEDLKTLINWDALGFVISATARSGRQALRIYESCPVDLIITDISMPNMDGITLIEHLQQKNARPIFLLLTAYAEINYMKKAFRLGVEDYLIKDEITPDILLAKLELIRKKYLSSYQQSYSFLQKNLRLYFNDSEAECPQELSMLPAPLLYCILAPDVMLPWIDGYVNNLSFSITRIIDSALPYVETYQSDDFQNICSVAAFNNRILILIYTPEVSSTDKLLKNLWMFSNGLVDALQNELSLSFSCFYNYIPMSLQKLHEDFFSHQKEIRARYFLGPHLCEALNSSRLYITNEKLELTEDSLKDILERPEGNLPDFISAQFQQIMDTHNYIGLSSLINICFSFLAKRLDLSFLQPEQVDFSSVSSVRDLILRALQELYRERGETLSYETKKAVAYIAAHYDKENLSLQEIADEISLSVTHFSRIFKIDTGETVWDYLTAFRMRKACELLRTTDCKIYEIAEKTGYSSPQYFSQVFYRQIGLKPLDYRKRERS